jgi:hypothetical protein
MMTPFWFVRDAETGEQLSGLFSFKRDAEKRIRELDFLGRPMEVCQTIRERNAA